MAGPELLTAGTEDHDHTKLDGYRAVAGYEALARARSGGDVEAFSAGSRPKPLHPNAARVARDELV